MKNKITSYEFVVHVYLCARKRLIDILIDQPLLTLYQMCALLTTVYAVPESR